MKSLAVERILRAVNLSVLEVFPRAQEIWFHGPRATGHAKRTSDWDFFVVIPDAEDEIAANQLARQICRMPGAACLHLIAVTATRFHREPGAGASYWPAEKWARAEGKMIWKRVPVASEDEGLCPYRLPLEDVKKTPSLQPGGT